MSIGEIFTYVVMVVLLVNIVLTVVVPLMVSVINYTFRSDLSGWVYQDLKGRMLPSLLRRNNRDVEVAVFADIILPIITMGLLTMMLFCGIETTEPRFWTIEYIAYLILALLSLPLLRWLVDVARNLKVNKSSGDSERLAELESQIKTLQQNVNK